MLALWGEEVPALLFLSGAIPLLMLSAWNRVRPPTGNPRLLARVSVPVVVLACGTALAALGATAGLWLFLIGVEVGVFPVAILGGEFGVGFASDSAHSVRLVVGVEKRGEKEDEEQKPEEMRRWRRV